MIVDFQGKKWEVCKPKMIARLIQQMLGNRISKYLFIREL